jgi:hypothetical protein
VRPKQGEKKIKGMFPTLIKAKAKIVLRHVFNHEDFSSLRSYNEDFFFIQYVSMTNFSLVVTFKFAFDPFSICFKLPVIRTNQSGLMNPLKNYNPHKTIGQ